MSDGRRGRCETRARCCLFCGPRRTAFLHGVGMGTEGLDPPQEERTIASTWTVPRAFGSHQAGAWASRTSGPCPRGPHPWGPCPWGPRPCPCFPRRWEEGEGRGQTRAPGETVMPKTPPRVVKRGLATFLFRSETRLGALRLPRCSRLACAQNQELQPLLRRRRSRTVSRTGGRKGA